MSGASGSNANANAGDEGGSIGGGFLSALGCNDCWPQTGLVTRVLLVEGVLGALLGALGLASLTMCCPGYIIDSQGVGLYRVLTSPLISYGLLSGLFALLTLWQVSRGMEDSRGSLWFGATILQITLVTNVAIVLLGLFAWALDIGFVLTSVCSAGLWPACFGLMVLEAMQDPDANRRFMCCCDLANKYHPPLMLLLFTLLMGMLDLGMCFGLAVGYALHYRSQWQLSIARATRWEASPKLAWLTQRDGFRRAADGGVQVLGSGGGWPSSAHPPAGPSRFASVHSSSTNVVGAAGSGSSAPLATPSVFSGQGHRLGGAGVSSAPAASSSQSSFLSALNPFSSTSAAQSAPGGEQGMGTASAPADTAAQAEARRQRAAAFDRRMGGGKGSAATGTKLASPRAGTTASSVISPSGVQLRGPPSPSAAGGGSRPSADAAAAAREASSMFSLGLDDDGAEYADPDESMDLEKGGGRSATAAAAPSSSSSQYQQEAQEEAEEEEPQGYVTAGRTGKKGYAQVDLSGDADDDEEQGLAGSGTAEEGEHDDNASERTAMPTQR